MTEAATLHTSMLDHLADRGKGPNSYQVREIPLEHITPNPGQPRQAFRDDASPEEKKAVQEHVASLSASIKAVKRVLQPILVRPGAEPNRFVIIDGECRWRASALAELPTIIAIVMPPDVESSADDHELWAYTANMHRKDLSLRDEVATVGSLLRKFDGNKSALARYLGWPAAKLSKTLGVQQLAGLALDALVGGFLVSAETAVAFNKLHRTAQLRLLTAARATGRTIPRSEVERADKTRSKATAPPSDSLYRLPALTEAQATALFAVLGDPLPERSAVPRTLVTLLDARVAHTGT